MFDAQLQKLDQINYRSFGMSFRPNVMPAVTGGPPPQTPPPAVKSPTTPPPPPPPAQSPQAMQNNRDSGGPMHNPKRSSSPVSNGPTATPLSRQSSASNQGQSRDKAATTIQAMLRGKSERKKNAANTVQATTPPPSPPPPSALNEAATKIQAAARGVAAINTAAAANRRLLLEKEKLKCTEKNCLNAWYKKIKDKPNVLDQKFRTANVVEDKIELTDEGEIIKKNILMPYFLTKSAKQGMDEQKANKLYDETCKQMLLLTDLILTEDCMKLSVKDVKDKLNGSSECSQELKDTYDKLTMRKSKYGSDLFGRDVGKTILVELQASQDFKDDGKPIKGKFGTIQLSVKRKDLLKTFLENFAKIPAVKFNDTKLLMKQGKQVAAAGVAAGAAGVAAGAKAVKAAAAAAPGKAAAAAVAVASKGYSQRPVTRGDFEKIVCAMLKHIDKDIKDDELLQSTRFCPKSK